MRFSSSSSSCRAPAVEVIDLSSDHMEDTPTTTTTTDTTAFCNGNEDTELFRGVRLRDLVVGDRLGARRDGGDGFQVRFNISAGC